MKNRPVARSIRQKYVSEAGEAGVGARTMICFLLRISLIRPTHSLHCVLLQAGQHTEVKRVLSVHRREATDAQ